MDIHKNARLSFRSREDLARYVVEQGGTRKAAAAAFRVSAKTVAKWVARFHQTGIDGLLDRSSRLHRSPCRLPESLMERVVECAAGTCRATRSRAVREPVRPRSAASCAAHDSAVGAISSPRRQSCAMNTPLRATWCISNQRNDALFRGQPARRWAAARQTEASWLPGPACGRRRPLAHGLYPDAARSESRYHHRLPPRGGGLLRQPRHRHTRPAHRQRLQLPVYTVPPSLSQRQTQTPPNTALYAKNQRQGRTLHPDRIARVGPRKTLGQSDERDNSLKPWTDYYNLQRPHGSLNYKPPISRSEYGTTS